LILRWDGESAQEHDDDLAEEETVDIRVRAMPKKRLEAHRKLDDEVDRCYRKAIFNTERERVEFLFDRYEALTNLFAQLARAWHRSPGRAVMSMDISYDASSSITPQHCVSLFRPLATNMNLPESRP